MAPDARSLLDDLGTCEAGIVEERRIIRSAKRRLRTKATARDRLIAQLEDLGIVVEEAQTKEDRRHGHE